MFAFGFVSGGDSSDVEPGTQCLKFRAEKLAKDAKEHEICTI